MKKLKYNYGVRFIYGTIVYYGMNHETHIRWRREVAVEWGLSPEDVQTNIITTVGNAGARALLERIKALERMGAYILGFRVEERVLRGEVMKDTYIFLTFETPILSHLFFKN